MHSYHLRKAIRAVHLVDSFKDRQEFFEDYVSRHFTARLVLGVYLRLKGTPLSALMLAAFGMRYLFKTAYAQSAQYKLLFPIDYTNEKRAINDFLGNVGDEIEHVPAIRKIARTLSGLNLFPQYLWLSFRFAKYLRHYEQRGTFLTCCRISETIWLYAKARNQLRRQGSRGIVVATNYSPSACALIAAARSNGLPVIYTFHAIIPYDFAMPPLEADLAFLYSKRAIEAFAAYGGVRCRKILFNGIPGVSKPMSVTESFDSVRTVGVFLTGYTIQQAFEDLIHTLDAQQQISHIIIRPHPLRDANPELSFVSHFAKVEIDGSGRAADTASKCDVVIAGSSSVHVEVLKSGKPTLYWEGFDTIGPDYYRLIRDGIVRELADVKQLDWDGVRQFYANGWAGRFEEFDCSYLKEPQTIKSEMKAALEQVLAGQR